MLASLSSRRLAARYILHKTSTVGAFRHRTVNGRRTFISTALQELSEGFLDLAITLPFPHSLPPYAGTIIVTTVVTRLIFTVPFSIWAKRRQWRGEDVVVPLLQAEKPAIYQKTLQEMRRDHFRGTKDEAKVELAKRAKPLLTARRKELCSLHNCSPIPTMLIPPLTQMPLFIAFSSMLSVVSQQPTVLDSESFLTLTSLAHPDPTATLPIVLGLITLANVESSRWFISSEALEREKKVAEWNAQKRAQGHTVIEPKKIVQSSLRILAIGRILIAIMVPGSVQLYWVTSAAFGLLQSWMLDWWDTRRRTITLVQRNGASATVPSSTVVFTSATPADPSRKKSRSRPPSPSRD